MLLDDVAIVFFGRAPQEFEEDDEEDYSDAGAGEHGFGAYVPGLCDETCVYNVPIPQHLRDGLLAETSFLLTAREDGIELTLILHPPIISAISSMPPIPPDEVAIGAMPVAVDAIDMPDIAIPVLVGAIDISISIDMIACTCIER